MGPLNSSDSKIPIKYYSNVNLLCIFHFKIYVMSNTSINFIATPFEQFQVGSVLPSSGIINVFGNNYFILVFVMFSFLYFQYESNATNMTVIPNKYHATLEGLYGFLYSMSVENIAKKGNDFFPLSLTITSQLQFVLALALGLFIGINIIGFLRHGLHFFFVMNASRCTFIHGSVFSIN